MFGKKKRTAQLRAIVRDELGELIREFTRAELLKALESDTDIRYVIMQGARAEAWALWVRIESSDEDPAETRLCHFCPFQGDPVSVAMHEAEQHGARGPLP